MSFYVESLNLMGGRNCCIVHGDKFWWSRTLPRPLRVERIPPELESASLDELERHFNANTTISDVPRDGSGTGKT